MAKISIVPWTSKKTRDGTVPLYLVIHHKKERSTIALPIRIKAKDWNPVQKEIRKSNRHHARLNPYLKSMVMRAEDALLDAIVRGDELSTESIKRAVKGTPEPDAHDFLEDFERRIQEFRDRGQHGSVDAYSPVFSKLRDYTYQRTGRRELPYEELTVSFLRGFDTYLVKTHGNSVNTVTKNLGYVRSVLYIAIREGRFPQDRNPFFNMTLKSQRAEKAKLTIEEIWALEDTEFNDSPLNDARNYFVFAFYAAGMRVSDVIFLSGSDVERVGDAWRLSYTMIKTGKASYPMILVPAAEKILRYYGWPGTRPDEYIFPIMPAEIQPGTREGFVARKRATATLNRLLKEVGRQSGIHTPITTHMARHSWTYHLDRNNIPVQRISDTLAHEDLKTTQAYVKKVRSSEVDDELTKILARPIESRAAH